MIIKNNISLKQLPTICIGGNAKRIIFPECLNDIINIKDIIVLPKTLILGKGSNIAFKDDGYKSDIISLKYYKNDSIKLYDDKYISVSSNISCSRFAKYCYKRSIPGFEFLHGIPGSIGGALAMNAGAFKQEIWDHVNSVNFINKEGLPEELPRAHIKTSYRRVYKEKIVLFLNVVFLINSRIKFNKNILENYSKQRTQSQPVRQKSSGCIFKNPSIKKSASELIDSSNILSRKIGGIYISQKHCNYFINDGTGTCKDLEMLINKVKKVVKNKYNIILNKEICIY